jgi:cytochrome c553
MSTVLSRLVPGVFVIWGLVPLVGLAAQDYEPDLRNGRDINELCAGCHGEFGQGSKDGEYPRIAGQPAGYTDRQLKLFRSRAIPNIPMAEHVDERQMPDPDIADVSAFLETIEIQTRMPELDENDPKFDALSRLLLAKQVLQIPKAEGDIGKGEKLYRKECRSCHGDHGEGNRAKAMPMLTGQYTEYLWRQIEKYKKNIRIHDPESPEQDILREFTDEELHDILAYLSILDD